jgi:hypothetical protein
MRLISNVVADIIHNRRVDRIASRVNPSDQSIAASKPERDGLNEGLRSLSGGRRSVPAVVRYAIPEANPSLYFTMSLAITFPFNILIGLPLYLWIIEKLW